MLRPDGAITVPLKKRYSKEPITQTQKFLAEQRKQRMIRIGGESIF